MEKKTKQVHKSPEEVGAELADQKESQNDQDCAAEVEAILKKYNRALQPFIPQDIQYGIMPRVRLVRTTVSEDTDVEESA